MHRSALHGAIGQAVEPLIHLLRVTPVVRRAGLVASRRADVGALFDTGDIVRVRAMVVAAGPFLLVKLDKQMVLSDAIRVDMQSTWTDQETRQGKIIWRADI